MNRQELINENLDECAVIRECDAGTDASERLAAVIAERDKLKNCLRERLAAAISEREELETMRQRLATVIAERDGLKLRMHVWMVAAIANTVAVVIATFAR